MARARPQVFNVLRGPAASCRPTRYGTVGEFFSGEGIELVSVTKQDEEIDSGWFSQPTVDLILVLQGELRVEFAVGSLEDLTLTLGDLLVLPADTRCRAYRWPRDAEQATIFVAVYPFPG